MLVAVSTGSPGIGHLVFSTSSNFTQLLDAKFTHSGSGRHAVWNTHNDCMISKDYVRLEPAGLVVEESLANFLLRVHHEGPLSRNRFFERSAGDQ